MKKILTTTIIFICIASMVFAMYGCTPKKETIDIALIATEKSMIADKSFNQAAWEGIKEYADANNKKYDYYEPQSKSNENYLAQIEEAINDGAKIIVTPGYNFESVIFEAQTLYPDVKFILIDGYPNNGDYEGEYKAEVKSNTYSILFAEEQAGFLAGYSIVKDGFTKLGFMGGLDYPAVKKYGYGFIQGAEFAALEMGLPQDAIEIKYTYTGTFEPGPSVQTKAASWYNSGTQVIFACAGGAGISVMKAAEAESMDDKWVIGVDSDQSFDSETVITSSMKMIRIAVFSAIEAYYKNEFPGGKSQTLGADEDGIGLSISTSKFKRFTKTEYESFYNDFKSNKNNIRSNILYTDTMTIAQISTFYVSVVELAFSN